jgi:Rit1 N-terminal domain
MDGFMYIQGAADDEESWSHGLKSELFWEHHQRLLRCTGETEVFTAIREIVERDTVRRVEGYISGIGGTNLSLGMGDAGSGIGNSSSGMPMIVCGGNERPEGQEEEEEGERILYVSLPRKGKLVTILTQRIFPNVVSFALDHGVLNHRPITVTSIDSSRQNLDLSIAIGLVLLSLFFNDKGIPLSLLYPCIRLLYPSYIPLYPSVSSLTLISCGSSYCQGKQKIDVH